MRSDKTDMYCHPEVTIDLHILKAEGREEQYRSKYVEPPCLQGDEWLDAVTLELRFVDQPKEALLEQLDQIRLALEIFFEQGEELELPNGNQLGESP